MKKNAVISILTCGVLFLILSGCEQENLAPLVDAGPDLGVTPPNNKTELKGIATDPDGSIVSNQWTQVSGPSPTTLTDPSALTTWVEGLVEGTYVFQLQATDNKDLSATDKVTVWVGDPCAGCWDY